MHFVVSFGHHLGDHFACFLEGSGTLKIEPERSREYDFHTLEPLFAGLISRLEFAVDFLQISSSFYYFWRPFGSPFGSLWLESGAEKEGSEKSEKEVMRCAHFGRGRRQRVDPRNSILL